MAGTGVLVRLVLRRDRLWPALWVVLIAAFVYGTVSTIGTLMPTEEARREYAGKIAANPAVLLIQGPAYDLSVGAIAAQQRAAATMIFAALGSVLFLVRHTRSDEQAGRCDLIGAAPVGRHAPLTAALTVVLVADALLAVLITAVLAGAGMPFAGSLAWGLIAACGGWVAAGMAAVAVQVTPGARPAGLGALGLFFALYLLRGVSDVAAPWLGWAVPTGWLLRSRPFSGERWWAFALAAALAAVLVALAYRLAGRRDAGAGLLPERAGRVAAAAWLRTPLALAWRTQRATAVAWLVAAVLFGLALGFGGREAVKEFGASAGLAAWAARMGAEADPAQVFYGLVIYVFGAYTVSLYTVLAVSRLWQEETGGLAEAVLAGPTGRLRWAAGHLLVAVAVPAALLAVVGLLCGLGSGDVGGLLALTLPLLPAVWVVTGVTVCAYGLLGRAGAVAVWAVFGLVVALEFGWEIGLVTDAAFRLSPFAHVHYSALAEPGPATIAVLTVAAGVFTALGLTALGRRDIG
ncbi:ABC-2 type transport system permease protein [Nonomuraea thailandensis]|uniref:ABC-2 type transport system permease protein n=1 Tax=Nonomuraea thailandensis TaxID=1188745 RepID=A0A9X2GH63_9ACTN|nr:antibiotic ABC transporter [Nonomuraea thailandensis]MCP2358502.1 ABC-2 type transport system permease protein [Nonomuraea thailandensis]